MSPVNQFGLWLSSTVPWLLKPVFLPIAALLRHLPQLALAVLYGRAVPPDRSVLNHGEIRSMLLQSFREAMRHGYSGAVEDLCIYGRPWGFSLREIVVPVHLWHGEKDRIVPPAMGRWMATTIPGSHAAFFPDEGHFSLIANQMNRILSQLAA
jgi:pimeloyl-ACP methyl ester carboxylesterase